MDRQPQTAFHILDIRSNPYPSTTTFLLPPALSLPPSPELLIPNPSISLWPDPYWAVQHPPMVVTAGDSQRERRVFVLYKFTPLIPPIPPPSTQHFPVHPSLSAKRASKSFYPSYPTHPGGLMELWGDGGVFICRVMNTSRPMNIEH